METSKTFLAWNKKGEIIKINNLKQLLNTLIEIKQEDIDNEINKNLKNLISWLEREYPKMLVFTIRLKTESKEYTPLQIRERIIRDLRGIV